jgi:hypothetical protein
LARGSQQANTAATAAQGISNTQAGNSNALYGALAPELESQMANPQGINPTDLAKIKTSNQQSAGGSEAAAVGQGALKAARTRNAGGADAAIEASTRKAGEQLGSENLKANISNEQLKQQQRTAATTGLENLYGTSTGASVGALGQVANNVNANTNAANQSWDWAKYILDPALQAAGGH